MYSCHHFPAGVDEVEYSRYPSEAEQKVFLRAYLEERARLKGGCGTIVSECGPDPDPIVRLEGRCGTIVSE